MSSAFKMIEKVGEIVGAKDKIRDILCPLSREFTDFRETNAFSESYKTLYFIWKDPFMIAGNDTFINDILKQMNLENGSIENRYPTLDEKEIRKINPQIIFLSSEPYPFKKKHIQEFKEILPDAYIKVIDGELFSWYGSRLKHTVAYLEDLQKDIKLHFSKLKLH